MNIQLTNAASSLLKNALASLGWADSICAIHLGAKIQIENLNDVDPTKANDPEWSKKEGVYDFNADEIATIKTCFEKLSSKELIPVNELSYEVIQKLGLN